MSDRTTLSPAGPDRFTFFSRATDMYLPTRRPGASGPNTEVTSVEPPLSPQMLTSGLVLPSVRIAASPSLPHGASCTTGEKETGFQIAYLLDKPARKTAAVWIASS